jgi:hypothetical protein
VIGVWRLAFGVWRLAFGVWRLAFGVIVHRTEKAIPIFTAIATVASGEVFIVCRGMFSHVVIFWTDPAKPDAPAELLSAAKKYLVPIPGILNFHVGKMATSHRDVVDQTYQVALNIQFQSKQAQDEYQDHPQHLEFVKQCKPLFAKVVVYDFE